MYKILFLFLMVIPCLSCESNMNGKSSNPANQLKTFDYTQFKLKSGDILFQDSDCGPFCESIEKVTSGIQGSKFSHVGMIIKDEKGWEEMVPKIVAKTINEKCLFGHPCFLKEVN